MRKIVMSLAVSLDVPVDLRLRGTQAFGNGVVQLRYAVIA